MFNDHLPVIDMHVHSTNASPQTVAKPDLRYAFVSALPGAIRQPARPAHCGGVNSDLLFWSLSAIRFFAVSRQGMFPGRHTQAEKIEAHFRRAVCVAHIGAKLLFDPTWGRRSRGMMPTPYDPSRSRYLCAIGVPISVPITSPEITSSTRRFCCRPAAVSFEATGCVFPKPLVVTEVCGIPCCVK